MALFIYFEQYLLVTIIEEELKNNEIAGI